MNDAALRQEDDVGELIALYIETRDAKETLVKKQRAHTKKYDQVLGVIEARLLNHIRNQNVQSISSGLGTAYLATKRSASINDPVSFKDYVISNRDWSMLDWKANLTAVQDFLAEHQMLPPGVKLNAEQSVNVMRK